jgi:hypothetical protein
LLVQQAAAAVEMRPLQQLLLLAAAAAALQGLTAAYLLVLLPPAAAGLSSQVAVQALQQAKTGRLADLWTQSPQQGVSAKPQQHFFDGDLEPKTPWPRGDGLVVHAGCNLVVMDCTVRLVAASIDWLESSYHSLAVITLSCCIKQLFVSVSSLNVVSLAPGPGQ